MLLPFPTPTLFPGHFYNAQDTQARVTVKQVGVAFVRVDRCLDRPVLVDFAS